MQEIHVKFTDKNFTFRNQLSTHRRKVFWRNAYLYATNNNPDRTRCGIKLSKKVN